MSDCKKYGTVQACATGDGPHKPSSNFFQKLCPAAYSWALDDHTDGRWVNNMCPKGVRSLKVVFGKIF